MEKVSNEKSTFCCRIAMMRHSPKHCNDNQSERILNVSLEFIWRSFPNTIRPGKLRRFTPTPRWKKLTCHLKIGTISVGNTSSNHWFLRFSRDYLWVHQNSHTRTSPLFFSSPCQPPAAGGVSAYDQIHTVSKASWNGWKRNDVEF